MKHTNPSGRSETSVQRQQRNQFRMGIRVLVILYLCYLIYALIQGYRRGEPGMSGGMVALFCVLFAAAIVVIAALSLWQWKRGKEAAARLEAEERIRAEAERQRQTALEALEGGEEEDP